jgi:hypothetical protein
MKNIQWVQHLPAKLMMRGITGTENGVVVVEPAVEPGTLYRLWILVEERLEERRVAHMELFGRDANDGSYAAKVSLLKPVAYAPCRIFCAVQ